MFTCPNCKMGTLYLQEVTLRYEFCDIQKNKKNKKDKSIYFVHDKKAASNDYEASLVCTNGCDVKTFTSRKEVKNFLKELLENPTKPLQISGLIRV